MRQLVVWTLDAQHYALPFDVVERVMRAVEPTMLPDAPEIVCGIVNIQGRVIPIINMRRRFHLPARDIGLTDHLVLAHTAHRPVAFFADNVSGVIDYPKRTLINADSISPELGCIAGVVKFEDDLILIHDLDRFLSLDEEKSLDQALSHAR